MGPSDPKKGEDRLQYALDRLSALDAEIRTAESCANTRRKQVRANCGVEIARIRWALNCLQAERDHVDELRPLIADLFQVIEEVNGKPELMPDFRLDVTDIDIITAFMRPDGE